MSKLKTALDEYLAVRRALGYKLYDVGLLLQQFVAFAEHACAAHITTNLALKWATQPAHAQRTWWAARLGVVRRFAQYCSCHDPRTQVPPPGLLPIRSFECRRTFIETSKSEICSRQRGGCPPRWAASSHLRPHCLAYMPPPVCGPASLCVSIVTTSIWCMAFDDPRTKFGKYAVPIAMRM